MVILMKTLLCGFLRDEKAQDMVEYALVVGIISLGCAASMTTIAEGIVAMWVKVNDVITNATAKIT